MAHSFRLPRNLPPKRHLASPGEPPRVYGCSGPASGDCTHNHRSLRTALMCLRKGGDDRGIVRRDGMGEVRTLSEAELGFVVDLVLVESELG